MFPIPIVTVTVNIKSGTHTASVSHISSCRSFLFFGRGPQVSRLQDRSILTLLVGIRFVATTNDTVWDSSLLGRGGLSGKGDCRRSGLPIPQPEMEMLELSTYN